MEKIDSNCKCYSCKHRGHPVADEDREPRVCQECYDLADEDGFVFHRNWEPDYMPDEEEDDG